MRTILFLLALTASAFAQQQMTPPDYQFIIPSLEAQRNTALTNQALAEARERKLMEENAKLKTEIDQLKKSQAAKK